MNDVDAGMREDAARLAMAVREARVALANSPIRVLTDYEGEPIRCELSGLPIIEGDECVEDHTTGEIWLRSALGLPPRPEVDEIEETDDESEFEPEHA